MVRAEVKTQYGIDVSISTTQRRLREAGLHGRKARRQPRLTVLHKNTRLDFAKVHRDWTYEQWSEVIFSDESRLLLYRCDGRVYVRRMKGEDFAENCIQTTVKQTRGRMHMVWGCITSNGVGLLYKVDGNLNGESYINILENSLIPSILLHSLTGISIFQQDNALCHRARIVKYWFEAESVEVMEWSAQSPDLNLIENLWEQNGTKGQLQNPTSHMDLWSEVKNAWDQIESEKLVNLF